jgi:hypothetical protein
VQRLPPLTTAAAGPLLLATIAIGAVATWFVVRPDRERADAERAAPVTRPTSPRADDEALTNDFAEQLVATLAPDPQRSAVECPTSGTSSSKHPPRDAARPGTERWHRERFEELAQRDPGAFAKLAHERLGAADSLAEKVALLLVAPRRDEALGDELWVEALRAERGDAALREAAVTLLGHDARRSPAACRRLWTSGVLERGLPSQLRLDATRAAAALADETLLTDAASTLRDEPDAAVRGALLRGLKRNAWPAAAALARELALTSPWREESLALEQELEASAATPDGSSE